MRTWESRVREKRWVRGWISYEKELVLEWVCPLLGEERGKVDVSRAWIGRTGVEVGGFVGLSTMLNNISEDENMGVTGS